ncbi:unnamed protein product [Ixodes pacificus]
MEMSPWSWLPKLPMTIMPGRNLQQNGHLPPLLRSRQAMARRKCGGVKWKSRSHKRGRSKSTDCRRVPRTVASV